MKKGILTISNPTANVSFTVNAEPDVPAGFNVTIQGTGDCPYMIERAIVYDGTSTSGINLGTVGSLGSTFRITTGHIYVYVEDTSDERFSGATGSGGVTNAESSSSSDYTDVHASADVSGDGTLTIDTYLH